MMHKKAAAEKFFRRRGSEKRNSEAILNISHARAWGMAAWAQGSGPRPGSTNHIPLWKFHMIHIWKLL